MLKVGDKVRFVSAEDHKKYPFFYPPVGTVGEIILIEKDKELLVRWEKSSTSDDDEWYCKERDVEGLRTMDFKEAIKKRNRMCELYKCCDCPMGPQHNGTENECDVLINDTPELAESILEKWASENKPLTNAEKLKEIFPNMNEDAINCTCPKIFLQSEAPECDSFNCYYCAKDFWNAPYEPPKEG